MGISAYSFLFYLLFEISKIEHTIMISISSQKIIPNQFILLRLRCGGLPAMGVTPSFVDNCQLYHITEICASFALQLPVMAEIKQFCASSERPSAEYIDHEYPLYEMSAETAVPSVRTLTRPPSKSVTVSLVYWV